MDYLVSAVLVGAGATAVMDLWTVARQRLLGVPAFDYGLVGRWLVHMTRGRFRHQRIGAAAPVPGERAIGWAAHYLIGIAFAAVLLAIFGAEWARSPTRAPALAVGIGSVAAPVFLMQPRLGAGIAASRTPRPNAARFQSLVTHTIFGLGLYAAGLMTNFLRG